MSEVAEADLQRQVAPLLEQANQLSGEAHAFLVAALLSQYEQGFLPRRIFDELMRLGTGSTVEVVPLQINPETDQTEVLLTQRPPNDIPKWANRWHVPGSLIVPKVDNIPHDDTIDFDDPNFDPLASYGGPIRRILKKELKDGVVMTEAPKFVTARFRQGDRGFESTVMFRAEVERLDDVALPVGRFFPAEGISQNPPEGGLIVGHGDLIERAAAAYAAQAV